MALLAVFAPEGGPLVSIPAMHGQVGAGMHGHWAESSFTQPLWCVPYDRFGEGYCRLGGSSWATEQKLLPPPFPSSAMERASGSLVAVPSPFLLLLLPEAAIRIFVPLATMSEESLWLGSVLQAPGSALCRRLAASIRPAEQLDEQHCRRHQDQASEGTQLAWERKIGPSCPGRRGLGV